MGGHFQRPVAFLLKLTGNYGEILRRREAMKQLVLWQYLEITWQAQSTPSLNQFPVLDRVIAPLTSAISSLCRCSCRLGQDGPYESWHVGSRQSADDADADADATEQITEAAMSIVRQKRKSCEQCRELIPLIDRRVLTRDCTVSHRVTEAEVLR